MFKRTAILIAALLSAVPVAAYASTASVVAWVSGDSRIPLIPPSVGDSDYPLESLVANEEGRTVLNVSVGADGRVTGAKVSASSGYRHLDDAAVEIAKAQWVFWPKPDTSRPSLDEVMVQVDWDLPLDPISSDAPSAARAENSPLPFPDFRGGVAPQAINASITLEDYPPESIRNNEQGIVRVLILIQKDGMVGEVKVAVSSGVPRLDEAARQMIVRRWRYRPATVNGIPIETWTNANVVYQLARSVTPPKECLEQPVLANERVPRVSLFGSLTLRRQVFADENGDVRSALLLTEKGWMQLRAQVRYLGQPIHFNPKPTINGTPARCWYDADVTIKVR